LIRTSAKRPGWRRRKPARDLGHAGSRRSQGRILTIRLPCLILLCLILLCLILLGQIRPKRPIRPMLTGRGNGGSAGLHRRRPGYACA
jgi:hypothetical protein